MPTATTLRGRVWKPQPPIEWRETTFVSKWIVQLLRGLCAGHTIIVVPSPC